MSKQKNKILPEDFLIKVNPHLTSTGKWNGGIEVSIIPNLENPLDDDDYFQIEHICKMICGSLNYLETDHVFREKMSKYVVDVIDKEYMYDVPKTKAEITKEFKDNVVSIDFKSKTRH